MSLGKLNIVRQTNKKASAAVVFLHGSGDTGQGILDWVKFLLKDFSSPYIKYYFPTAPLRPYTPLGGDLSHVWFDRYDITPEVPEHTETLDSIGKEVTKLFEEIETEGTPKNRIIVGGFSMGGSLALHTAYRFVPGLAGCFTLSSFVNKNSALLTEAQSKETPLFMAHGDRDTLVPLEWGQKSHRELASIGINGSFNVIKNCLHELKKDEIKQLFEWINKNIPPLDENKE